MLACKQWESACPRMVLRVLVLGGGERSCFTTYRWDDGITPTGLTGTMKILSRHNRCHHPSQAGPRLSSSSSLSFDAADIRPHPCQSLSPAQRSAAQRFPSWTTLASTECGPLYLGSFTPRAVGVHGLYSGHPTAVIVSSQAQAHPTPSRIDGRVTANGPGNTVISLNPSERSIKPKMAQPHGWRTETLA